MMNSNGNECHVTVLDINALDLCIIVSKYSI